MDTSSRKPSGLKILDSPIESGNNSLYKAHNSRRLKPAATNLSLHKERFRPLQNDGEQASRNDKHYNRVHCGEPEMR